MSINTKMTALANEIRTLSGTTAAIGLDAMTSNINIANGIVDDQADLIEQIYTALAGKTSLSLTIDDTSTAYVNGEQLIL